MYTIRRVDHNTYDVFLGNQWSDHTRIRAGRSSTFVVSGQRLPHPFLKYMHTVLHPSMPINYGQPHELTLDNCFNHLTH